ncbi:MAG: sirohydrochlorin cobaltochelatase [Deltaproteobacteria bacterium]|nr:sirohydrochlorin cobaltochelatase [Deltaproteobacteria bacterium]
MRRGSIALTIAFFFSYVLFIGFAEATPERPRPVKTGILLVAFGTSVPEAQKAYDHFERMVRAAFPETPVRWAYTSSMIRAKLARQGKPLDSMETALARMMDERFTHVAVQSLHVIAGWEFHEMQRNAGAFGAMAGGFDRITVGGPLLASAEDFTKVAQALLNHLPPGRKPKEAVVFMGHGTSHPSNAGYAALMYHLQRRDPGVFMGTVEESPTIEEIRDALVLRKVSRAYLMPFMAVAGDHARNDLAGDGEGSWKNVLARAGIKCTPVLAGAAEYEDIGMIWVEHLKAAVARLDLKP